MTSRAFCMFLLLVGFALATNRYYVKESTIVKNLCNWTMNLLYNKTNETFAANNPVIEKATLFIASLDSRVLRIKINDSNQKRWEAPIFNKNSGANYNITPMDSMGFNLTYKPFGFKITDPLLRETFVDMSVATGGSFQFNDKYLEIGMRFSSQLIFGFGERVTTDFNLCSYKKNCTYTMWARGAFNPIDDGDGTAKQLYGQQPFYMIQLSTSNKFIGVFLLNSNAQDMVIGKESRGLQITHKIIGGIFDLYFFYPGTAEEVIRKYHELVGFPYVPPFWSLGFHQSRYGWHNLAKVKDVVAKFEQFDIPLEVVWADIDYMDNYRDFSVDQERYYGLGDFVKKLHEKKIYWVPIIDAGLKYDPKDKYYRMGEEAGAFIKSAFTKKTLISKVWPGAVVYLSWYCDKSAYIWQTGLDDLYKQVEFDGIWLDMNEVSSFCDGECPPKSENSHGSNLRKIFDNDPHDPTEFDNLPYLPGKKDLKLGTMSLTGYYPSSDIDEDRLRKQYNTHGIWSVPENKVTHEFFTEKLKKRPFILTRANYPGSGMFASKWSGDNHSKWEYLAASIFELYNYQLFGIPLTGADICGFIGNTTEELCARWMQLGAFYPFSRNHNVYGAIDQEPYALGERVAKASRNAIRQKYSILRYYYTKIFEVSLYGGTVIRPTFFEYPSSRRQFSEAGHDFMIGSSILVVPGLRRGSKTVTITFPQDNWYSLQTGIEVLKKLSYEPRYTVNITDDYVNLFIRGGSIIPFQDALLARILRTETLRLLPMEILVAPDSSGFAEGSLVVDDGISANPIGNKYYRHLRFKFSKENMKLNVTVINSNATLPMFRFERFHRLTILGASKWNDIEYACLEMNHGNRVQVKGSYNANNERLSFYLPRSKIDWINIERISFNKTCG